MVMTEHLRPFLELKLRVTPPALARCSLASIEICGQCRGRYAEILGIALHLYSILTTT